MATRKSFTAISSRAKSLLRRQEGSDVEFKQSVSGLEASDIVAFANSSGGGTILIGVSEGADSAGRQVGHVVGCPTGDKAKLQVLDKAMSCVPPVQIQVIVENTGSKPFFRIEIPRGADRPYCTGGGTYKIREDGRVRALAPADLLAILLEREGAAFAGRFQAVASAILDHLEALANSVGRATESIESSVEDIASTLGWTDSKVDDTASEISATLNRVTRIAATLQDVEDRILTLVGHTGLPDPVKSKARERLIADFRKRFKDNPDLLEQLKNAEHGVTLSLSGGRIELFTQEELVAMLLEAAIKPA